MSRRNLYFFLLILAVVIPVALALWFTIEREPAKLTFKEQTFSNLKGWGADDQSGAFEAFLKSCQTLTEKPALGIPERFQTVEYVLAFAEVCRIADERKEVYRATDAAARTFFEEYFTPYQLKVGRKKLGQLTGYYEPLLEASLRPDPDYPVPLYLNPDDQIIIDLGKFRDSLKGTTLTGRLQGNEIVPYYSREEIEGGALAGQGLEFIWVKDPINAFFLQVQGSGRAKLPDGSFVGIGYAGKNGHTYTSIGRVMVEEGIMELEDVSLQTIRAWLEDHPDQLERMLNQNASYVFFRPLEDGAGPFGKSEAALTPGRSLAIDPRFIPLGLPLWIAGEKPSLTNPAEENESFQRLLITQDVGGAIKGELRADVFWGFGENAEILAGHMNHEGAFYLLIPKTVSLKN